MKISLLSLIVFFALICDVGIAGAQDKWEADCQKSASTKINLDKVSGVYKEPVNTNFADGSPYKAENILEIVPYTNSSAYIRLSLRFYNAHVCGLSGIAEVEGEFLIYKDHKEDSSTQCILKLNMSSNEVVLKDDSSCHFYCGMRGHFDGITFSKNKRRTIRYMDKLKSSRHYTDAVKEHEKKLKSCH